MVMSLSYGLLVKVPIEELVVQEHAGDIGYLGVVDPVRGAIKGLYPAVREHQRELSQEGPVTEDSTTDPIAKNFDLVALERVVALVAMRKFFEPHSTHVGDVIEPVPLL